MISTLLLSVAATLAGPTQAPADTPGGLRRGAFFGAAVAPLRPIEFLEDTREVVRGDARALVGDRQAAWPVVSLTPI